MVCWHFHRLPFSSNSCAFGLTASEALLVERTIPFQRENPTYFYWSVEFFSLSPTVFKLIVQIQLNCIRGVPSGEHNSIQKTDPNLLLVVFGHFWCISHHF
jgi:hypothetical protein